MGDNIYNVYLYLLNIKPDNTQERNLKKDDVAPAITFSIFDTKGKKEFDEDGDYEEFGDGIITKEEFNSVTKENYESYCKNIKEEISKDPTDPMKIIERSVRQYAEEEGIYSEDYIQKQIKELSSKVKTQEDLTTVTPISYEALKKYFEKHDSIDFNKLREKEIISNKTFERLDKNQDGYITKNENKYLYRKNKRKPLMFSDVVSCYFNYDEKKIKEKIKLD